VTVDVQEDSFESEVLQADVPVLVDFWADWCMPCKMIEPLMTELGAEYVGKLKVAGLDVTRFGSLAAKMNVVSIPTLILFKGGEEQERLVGAAAKEVMVELIEKYI
jgi:thioredoxin 1